MLSRSSCRSALHRDPTIIAALEHPRLFDLFAALLSPSTEQDGEDAASSSSSKVRVWTSAYKWLRGVPQGQCTGFHLDSVYMKGERQSYCCFFERSSFARCILLPLLLCQPALFSLSFAGSTPLYSLWLPLGDIPSDQGNLVVARGSHRSEQFARLRQEYGSSEAGAKGNGTTSGWIEVSKYTEKPVEVRAAHTQKDAAAMLDFSLKCGSALFALQWVSSAARAGSVILLDLRVLHCTSVNTSDQYRLSCDSRWTVSAAADGEVLTPPQASIHFKLRSPDT